MIDMISTCLIMQKKKGFDMNLLDSLGGRLMIARKSQGLTAIELIERLKTQKEITITSAHMSRIENDKARPSLDLLEAIADILNESIDNLLGRNISSVKGVINADVFISEEANQGGALIDKMSPDLRTFAIQILTNIDTIDQMFKEKNENLERTVTRLRLRRDQMAQLLDAAIADMKEPAQRRARSLLHDIDSRTE